MKIPFPQLPALSLALAIQIVGHTNAADITLSMETFKTAIVDVATPEATNLAPPVAFMLPGHNQSISYIAFDLSAVPTGSTIKEATVNVFDAEPQWQDVNELALLNIPNDWEPESLSFNSAMAAYGAAIIADTSVGYDISAFTPDALIWLGTATMDNLDAPGGATIGSTRAFQSHPPYTDSQFVDFLNATLTNNTPPVFTVAMRGQSPYDNYIIGKDYPDGENGPTLTLVAELPTEGGKITTYDFNDGTLQGWSQIMTSTTIGGPNELGIINDTDPPVGDSLPPLPMSPPGFVAPLPFEAADGTNTRDQAHQTLLLRSPEFTITPQGQISFALIGGSHPALNLMEVNTNGLPADSSPTGAIGVALRRVSDNQYLLFRSRISDGSQFWENITIGGDTLNGLVDPQETYTLDFIDSYNGGWGWAGLDDVIIIEQRIINASRLQVERNANNITVIFEGTLQTAPTPEGPWANSRATSPYTTTTTRSSYFMRAVTQ
jgi:hypothetical protein